MIEVALQKFSLVRGAFALKDICFTVAPGEIFAPYTDDAVNRFLGIHTNDNK